MEVPNSEFPLWASDSTFNKQIMYSNDLNIYYIGMNCERPPFNNKIVRLIRGKRLGGLGDWVVEGWWGLGGLTIAASSASAL